MFYIHLSHILKEDTAGDLVLGVRSETLLQDVQREAERHESAYGLTCARIVGPCSFHLTTRGINALEQWEDFED